MEGRFWLPNKPNNIVHGVLSNDTDKKIILKLDDGFNSDEIDVHPFVLGILSNGTVLTLQNCYWQERKVSMPGYTTSTWLASQLFEGIHLGEERYLSFIKAKIRFASLEKWFRTSPFLVDPSFNSLENISYKVVFQMPTREIWQVDSLNSTISITHNFDTKGSSDTTKQMNYSIMFEITPSESKSLDWFQRTNQQLCELISLLAGQYLGPTKTMLQHPNIKANTWVTLRTSTFSDITPNEDLKYYETLFEFPQIRNEFPAILNRWFDLVDELLTRA